MQIGQRVQSLTQPRKQGKIIDIKNGKAQVSWDVGWRSGWCKLENLLPITSQS